MSAVPTFAEVVMQGLARREQERMAKEQLERQIQASKDEQTQQLAQAKEEARLAREQRGKEFEQTLGLQREEAERQRQMAALQGASIFGQMAKEHIARTPIFGEEESNPGMIGGVAMPTSKGAIIPTPAGPVQIIPGEEQAALRLADEKAEMELKFGYPIKFREQRFKEIEAAGRAQGLSQEEIVQKFTNIVLGHPMSNARTATDLAWDYGVTLFPKDRVKALAASKTYLKDIQNDPDASYIKRITAATAERDLDDREMETELSQVISTLLVDAMKTSNNDPTMLDTAIHSEANKLLTENKTYRDLKGAQKPITLKEHAVIVRSAIAKAAATRSYSQQGSPSMLSEMIKLKDAKEAEDAKKSEGTSQATPTSVVKPTPSPTPLSGASTSKRIPHPSEF